jgi:hypothetical protein
MPNVNQVPFVIFFTINLFPKNHATHKGFVEDVILFEIKGTFMPLRTMESIWLQGLVYK